MHLPFFYCQVDSLLPPATTCSMCTWLGRVNPVTGARPASARSHPCQRRARVCGCCQQHRPPTRLSFCGCSLGICGRKCHRINRYCFHLPSFLFSLTHSLFHQCSDSSPLLGTSLFHLGKAPGLCGFASHLCKVAVGGGDSAAVSRSDTGGSTASSFIG